MLGILTIDPNPIIRTLVCCNGAASPATLRKIAKEGTDHMRLAIANNQNASGDVLETIVDLTSELEVLEAVKRHPKATPITRHRAETVLDGHRAALSRRGRRSY